MTDGRRAHRVAIADAAEAVLADPAAYAGFVALLQETDYEDPKLEALIDQIEHLPPRSRLFGLGASAHAAHFAMIRRLAAAARE